VPLSVAGDFSVRYYTRDKTLFIRGSFRAALTGPGGGIRNLTTIFMHHTGPETPADPAREPALITASEGLPCDSSGFLIPALLRNSCILQYDFVTVFISAAVGREDERGSAGIIVHSREGMTDGALLEAILAAGEACAEALIGDGYTGSSLHGSVVIASEGPAVHDEGGLHSPAGNRIRACILKGLPEAIGRSTGTVGREKPSLFVYSRFGGEHWVEWQAAGCPYYPCHFEGQRCDYCYCPFYPCGEEDLGQWVESSAGGKVWNCARCTLVHEDAVASHLEKNPGAGLAELRRVREKKAVSL
jgi:adenosylcobinamide hydrolase